MIEEVRVRHLASGAVVRCGERIASEIAHYYHAWEQRSPEPWARVPRGAERAGRSSAVRGGSHTSGPRTLVILSGSSRGGASTWRALHTNLLAPSRAELMLVVSQPWLSAMRRQPNASASLLAARRHLLDAANIVVGVPEFSSWAGSFLRSMRSLHPSRLV